MNRRGGWYDVSLSWPMVLLSPLEGLYRLATHCRHIAYKKGLLKTHRLPVPVWVVGNLTVGGTGKTPVVIAMVEWLKDQGLQPGVVSRGYGAAQKQFPYTVKTTDPAEQVGDEPLLIAQKTHCPVVIDPNRVRGGQSLVASGVNIIVSDDGFQHHRLHRDCNILVVDGMRRYGNGHCLPLGPLREPVSALKRAHFILCNGTEGEDNEYTMDLKPASLQRLVPSSQTTLDKHQPIHAVAAIGHPERFFVLLEKLGYAIIPHVFPDHHGLTRKDLDFGDTYPVIMTEKDAVKCKDFAQSHWWMLPVTVALEDNFWEALAYYLPVGDGCTVV